jgi:hypothetical protein
VLADVQRALGTSTHGTIAVRVVVERAEPGPFFRAEVTLWGRGETTTRNVDGDTCRGVADAVALIVAFASAALPEPEPPPAAPPVSAPRADGRQASRRGAPTLDVGASFLFDSVTLPSASYGGDLALAWRPSRLRVEADGAILAPVRGTVEGHPLEGASFLVVHGGLRASYDLIEGRFGLAPSAGLGIDWTIARGFGSQSPKDATGTDADVLLGGRAWVTILRHFTAFVRADAVIPTARPTFVVDGSGTVYHSPAASFRGALGAEVSF